MFDGEGRKWVPVGLERRLIEGICSDGTEKAMVETFGAHYVSLHVRVSNVAALRLYRDTLGFKVEKIEAKYYADGEDAYSMKMELGYIREEALDAESDVDSREDGVKDEGEGVGDVGKKGEGEEKEKKGKAKKRKVKVGRGLGVGDLVERNESQH